VSRLRGMLVPAPGFGHIPARLVVRHLPHRERDSLSRSPGSGSAPWTTARAVLMALWLGVVAALTLTPQPTAFLNPHVPQFSACLICGERGTADAFLNLLLLAPLGLLLNDRGWKPVRAALTALALSTCIESAQHFIPGRDSALGDVVWNTTGAGLAALAWSVRTRWLPGGPREAARLRNLAVLMAALVTFAFGWLLVPSLPNVSYWGQWTPALGFMPQYRGAVLHARLDSILIPPGRFPRRADPRSLLEGDWDIDLTFVKGPPPSALAPILNIYDARQREVLLLGAIGESFVFRERSRAQVLRFDYPDLRLPGVMASVAVGDTVHAAVLRQGPRRCLVFEATRACRAFTPGRAWSLLEYPHRLAPLERRLLDALWLCLLLVPVGFWSLDARRLAAAGGASALGIALAVALTRLAPPPWTQVAGALVGLLLGWGLRLLATVATERPS